MILIEEETGAAMFIIISGKVKVVRMDEKGKGVILSILTENDFLERWQFLMVQLDRQV